MTSISATGAQAYQSPLNRLLNELQSEVSSGQIAATDQSALSDALKDIDSTLTSERSSGTLTLPPSRDAMQTKINNLIDNEVQSGKLTDDQAGELKNLFETTFSQGPGGAGGPGGPRGAGGPPPGGPPPGGGPGGPGGAGDAAGQSSDTDDASTDISKLLQEFLDALQNSQSTGSSYSASGNATSSLSALLINYQS